MRRAARERFRVYTEEEFFADPAVVLHERSIPSHGRRSRIAGVALLVGAIGSVAGVAGAWLLASPRYVRAGRATPARSASAAVSASTAVGPRDVQSSSSAIAAASPGATIASRVARRRSMPVRRGTISPRMRGGSPDSRAHRAGRPERRISDGSAATVLSAVVAGPTTARPTAVAEVGQPRAAFARAGAPAALHRRGEFGFER